MRNDRYNSFRRFTDRNQEARWASVEEIKSNSSHINLSDENYKTCGLPILTDGKDAWVDGSDTHTIIFGSTGSKKTRLFVMPTVNMMIKAGESFVVTDPKGELYERTSGLAQANGYKVKVLNFRKIGYGETWNPFHYPYDLFKEGKEAQATSLLSDFMQILGERHEGKSKDPFWVDSAKAYGLASMLLLMTADDKAEVNATSFVSLCNEKVKRMISDLVDNMNPACACAVNYNGIIHCAQDTYRSVLISLFALLTQFVNQKDLTEILSESSFNAKDFGHEKTAFYIIVPDEKTSTHFLVTVFIKQVYEMLIEQAQNEKNGKLPVRVNFMLDEFCNVPKIPDMPNMISAARSRNIRFFLIAQSAHQLQSRYDVDADTIKGNCVNWVFLASKELSLLTEIRDLCGKTVDENGHEHSLISTSELQHLSKERGEALILHDRCYPIISEIADIDDYAMFKGFDAPEIPRIEHHEVKVYDLKKVYTECLKGLRPFPFSDGKMASSPIPTPGSFPFGN